MLSGVRTSSVAPAASTSPSAAGRASRHRPAAKFRSCVEMTIDDRDAALEVAQQRRDLELIGEIERGRRLVEQEDGAGGSARAADLRQRRGDDHALLLAAAQRRERPRSSRCAVPVAASASRAIAMIGRPLDLERAEMRVAAHHRDFEHAVVERQLRFLRHHRHPPRDRRARQRSPDRRRPASRGRQSASSVPARQRSSVVLPDPFGPSMPTKPPAGTVTDTRRSTGCASVS